jgi:superkiller protein 3
MRRPLVLVPIVGLFLCVAWGPAAAAAPQSAQPVSPGARGGAAPAVEETGDRFAALRQVADGLKSGYEQLDAKNMDEVQTLLKSGRCQINRIGGLLDRVQEALELLQSKMVYFENSPAIRDAIGQMLVQQGRYAEGAAILRQASILGIDEPTIREHLAIALFYARDYREAEVQLERLIKDERYRTRADLVLALGECQFQAGRPLDARGMFESASQLDPGSTAAWLSLTKAALRLSDLRRADLSVHKAIALEPQNSEAHLLLGYVRLHQNRLDEALTAFRKASELDPKDSTSLSMIGLTLEKQGQYAKAIACYGQALKLKPSDDLAKTLMAQAHE